MADLTITFNAPIWVFGLLIWSVLAWILSNQFKYAEKTSDSIIQVILCLPLVVAGIPFYLIELTYKKWKEARNG